MTLTEALYEALEVELIAQPDWQRMKCEHRIAAGFRQHPHEAGLRFFDRGKFEMPGAHILPPQVTLGDHHIDPETKMFPWESAGLLFDIHIKWWYCAGKKKLTFCWHDAVEANIAVYGIVPFAPVHWRDEEEGWTTWDCPICGQGFSSFGTCWDGDFRNCQHHIKADHYVDVVQFNADLREIAGLS